MYVVGNHSCASSYNVLVSQIAEMVETMNQLNKKNALDLPWGLPPPNGSSPWSRASPVHVLECEQDVQMQLARWYERF